MDTATLSFFEQQPEALPLYEAFAVKPVSLCLRIFCPGEKEERAARPLPCDHAWHALFAGISPGGREDRTLSGAVDDAYRDRISR